MARPTLFYATRKDLLNIFAEVNNNIEIKFTEAGMFDEPTRISFSNLEEVELFGISTMGHQIHEKDYLISSIEEDMTIREVPQRSGGIRYSIDQRSNPRTVGIKTGGVYENNIIIAGQLGCETEENLSIKLHNAVLKEIKKHFKKVKSYYIGQDALVMLDNGARLTINSKAPDEYDLKI